ncbi:MAG: 2-hydroxyacyl-CoA dehydratase family protein [Firmicutes bacterium]|nr:2-hydroxyacyl-CoA dehydratase [Dethiobacter sp.]MBS3899224.1 2-hydroxyacyl-CoA dehydratase [Dethiobacter sp.]MCL4462459.1 2-hydroxyacyl-CoA dehydratase family protein [Bacillota bacterium]MCL5993659.1 2-hydroxyacyl-CoA dehydratase family protein [Bacillota bacterium]
MKNESALAQVRDIYENRASWAKELSRGRMLIGYLCHFAPPEIISAAGMIPYRITGQLGDDIVEANRYIEPYGCPYVRNCFEQSLKGRLDFLEGRVIPHSCDMVQRIYGIWKYYNKPNYSYLFNVPHQVSPWSLDFFERELTFFKESLEKLAGHKISEEQLAAAIEVSNKNRRLIRELYDLRKKQPPKISGTEMLQVLLAGSCLPAEEYNELLEKVKEEATARKEDGKQLPTILVWGCIIDDIKFFDIIEQAGAYVVCDDLCIGTRTVLEEIDTTKGIMRGLTNTYLRDFRCPRTDHGPSVERFSYLLDLVREFGVQGVIGYALAFCDPHKLDYPDLRDYLGMHGIPMLLINDDYTLGNVETIKNRVQAFLEMLQ